MPTYPLLTVAATVTPSGISSPSYNDILASFQASVRSIFGSDVVIDPDSKDGQLLAILAQAQYDSNQCAIGTYNAYNPQTATGVALDSAVKVNGIRRQVASNSSAALVIIGQAGVQIYNGVVQDTLLRLWDLPNTVIIPPGGQVTVQATCEVLGAIQAGANTINTPFTKVLGWQTVTNPAPAVAGEPVETDGELRERQTESTAKQAMTTSEAIMAQVLNTAGVSRAALYENDTTATDANGIPGHSFCVVVEGGADPEVAQAIEIKKDVGSGTYGDTMVTVQDPAGIAIDIRFDHLTPVPLTVQVEIHTLPGFPGATLAAIPANLVDFVNSLGIGEDVYLSWMTAEAGLNANQTFVVVALKQSRDGAALAAADIPISFREAATLDLSNVTLLEV